MWLIVIILLWCAVHRAKRIATIHASHLFSHTFYFHYPHSSTITVKYKRQYCTFTFYYAKTRWLATAMTLILATLATEKIDVVVVHQVLISNCDICLVDVWFLFCQSLVEVPNVHLIQQSNRHRLWAVSILSYCQPPSNMLNSLHNN